MKKLILDLDGIIDSKTLHQYLARELDFADYYGHTFDAFWDCIADESLSTMPDTLIVKNLSKLRSHLPDEAKRLRSCLDSYQIEYPDRTVEFLD